MYGIIRPTYLKKLQDFNLIPILVSPKFGRKAIKQLYHESCEVVITRGKDIHPHYYNQSIHPQTEADDPARDEMELTLARQAK